MSISFTDPENIRPSKKQLYICRGVSGSGKSTLIEKITKNLKDFIVCSADHYFIKNGEYIFNVTQLGEAHRLCQLKAAKAMKENVPIVIIDNTNLKYWEMKFYIRTAKQFGYNVNVLQIHTDISLILERQTLGKNVPRETILNMFNKLENSSLPEDITQNTIHIKGE